MLASTTFQGRSVLAPTPDTLATRYQQSKVPPWQIFHQMTNGTLRPGRGPALRLDLANVRLACQGSTPAPRLQCWSQMAFPSNCHLFEIYTCKHTTNGANLCWETPHKRYRLSGGKETLNKSRGAQGLSDSEGAPQLGGLSSPSSWLKRSGANRKLASYSLVFKMIDDHT